MLLSLTSRPSRLHWVWQVLGRLPSAAWCSGQGLAGALFAGEQDRCGSPPPTALLALRSRPWLFLPCSPAPELQQVGLCNGAGGRLAPSARLRPRAGQTQWRWLWQDQYTSGSSAHTILFRPCLAGASQEQQPGHRGPVPASAPVPLLFPRGSDTPHHLPADSPPCRPHLGHHGCLRSPLLWPVPHFSRPCPHMPVV